MQRRHQFSTQKQSSFYKKKYIRDIEFQQRVKAAAEGFRVQQGVKAASKEKIIRFS
jgi:hypothetical protein